MRGMEPKPGREQQQQQDPPKGPPPEEEEEWNDLVKQHKVRTVNYTLRGCPTSPAARPWCGSTCWCNFILTSHRPPSNNWAPLQVHAAGHIACCLLVVLLFLLLQLAHFITLALGADKIHGKRRVSAALLPPGTWLQVVERDSWQVSKRARRQGRLITSSINWVWRGPPRSTHVKLVRVL